MKIIFKIRENSEEEPNNTESTLIQEEGGSGGSSVSGGAITGAPIVGVAGGDYNNSSRDVNLSQFRDIKTANKIRFKLLGKKQDKEKESTKKQVNNVVGNK